MNAAFVAWMEDMLAVYERPPNPCFPVLCFDERPCVLHGQPVEPLPPQSAQLAAGEQPAKAGRLRRESSTYVRQGTACLLAAFEPGTGQRLARYRPGAPGQPAAALCSNWLPTTRRPRKSCWCRITSTPTPIPSFTSICRRPKPAPWLPASRCTTRPKTPPGSIWSNSNSRLSPASTCTNASPPWTNSRPRLPPA